MQFKKIGLGDIPLIKKFLINQNFSTCDYTVGGCFMWRDFYNMEYAVVGDTLFSRLYNSQNAPYYNMPLGGDLAGAIKTLLDYTQGNLRFCTLPKICLDLIKDAGFNYDYYEQVDFADYLYNADDLIFLKGKKYAGQRNLINQFNRLYPNWAYHQITQENLDIIKHFFCNNYSISQLAGDMEREEHAKVKEVLDNYSVYGFCGAYLEVDGKVVGFSLGERILDTLFCHVEKADRNFKGAYQMLCNLFAKTFADKGVLYINREEDLGDAGLKKAKTDYHPVRLLNKFVITIK